MRDRNPQTYGDDVREMLERRLTFDEAITKPEFSLVSRQRLTIVRPGDFRATRRTVTIVSHMPGKTVSIDLQEMIAEVAKRHGIILAPDDAIFAVVTLNELVMKKTAQNAASMMAATVDRLQVSLQRAEARASQLFVQQARDSVQEFRTGLLQELARASMELN